MNYYTLQIQYNVPVDERWKNGIAIEERKDLNCGALNEKEWITGIRTKLFTTGFNTQTAPNCWEFISPLRIHTAYLIKQDKKFAP